MEKTRNDKSFFYVFPTLKVEDDIQILFTDVEVQKITTNSRRDFLHVYIYSRHLIQKRQIRQMEQRIKDQLFSKVPVDVQIEEEYALSGQYTPEALLREYRDSIILELKERSILASNMFAQAKIHYEDGNVVCLELLDSIVSEGRKEEILAFLENLFARRFHMKADIRITYREADGEGTREYDEQRVQQEINAIFERRARQNGVTSGSDDISGGENEAVEEQSSAGGSSERSSAGSGQKKEKSGADKDNVKRNAAQSGRRTGRKGEFRKKDFYRPVKQGDDPNLIYGETGR